ncbi:MAG: glycine--tRNA ligase subunit beta [Armatimonadetes bacterium RBG_16_67_12]|nr:MAG: glycine--tRNA ligase subunit beta [Armatimonadetes bacterium RBG_16_67_12]
MARQAVAATLLLEIGCEELPPSSVRPALEQLARDAAAALRDARLEGGEPRTTGTARRLALMVPDVAPRQADRVTQVRGPAARIAFDPSGAPTQAAQGFARSQGVPVEALEIREMDGGKYVVAEIREAGRPAGEVLAQVLPLVVAGLSFPKTMRWKAGGFRFGRPIRWVVALLDGRLIRLEVAGLKAGRRTRGHRVLAPAAMTLRDAGDYGAAMHKARVVLDDQDRRARIVEGAVALAQDAGGQPVIDAALLDELVWSTEHPTAVWGTFETALAATLPREVVLVTLQHHQKSFGVQDRKGALLPAFIAIRDGGAAHLASVRTGHEWVVRARLEDARFFLVEDRRGSFDRWIEELSRLAHVTGLGSVADHVARILRLTAWLADTGGISAEHRATLDRAAGLCKADLGTALVREYPELQGVIGRIYATEAGEPRGVGVAIEEHYWPKTAGGEIPKTVPGALLAIADRALLLAGSVMAGLEPTGSQDPYGLCRAAAGITAILAAHGFALALRPLFAAATATFDQPPDAQERAVTGCVGLTLQRLRMVLMDQGIAYDTIDAVLATQRDDVSDITARARALQDVRSDAAMPRLATGFARASRILGQGQAAEAVDEHLLAEGPERTLHHAWARVRGDVERAVEARRYADALQILERLADPIDRFFDDVLVMAPDPAVRANRLALLREVTAAFLRVADFSKLSG